MVGSTRLWPFPIAVASLTPASVKPSCLFLVLFSFCCVNNVDFSLVFIDFVVVSVAYPVNQHSYLLLICMEYVDSRLGAISCVDLSVVRSKALQWPMPMANRSRFGNSFLSREIYASLRCPLGSLTYVLNAYPRGFLGKARRGFLLVCVCWCEWVHL